MILDEFKLTLKVRQSSTPQKSPAPTNHHGRSLQLSKTMSNGPLPTHLILLSNLPSCSHGEKVRFLGCVSQYDSTIGTLCLEHAYPASYANVMAAVDVNLLLETLKCTDTRVGEWVNVMGYVQGAEEYKAGKNQEDKAGNKDKGFRRGGGKEASEGKVVKLQAVMLWSAEGVKVWEYEKALEMRRKVQVRAK
ncbi:MAG: hypothetical protein Q9221_007671 [Calogaya cf. arnoldii]